KFVRLGSQDVFYESSLETNLSFQTWANYPPSPAHIYKIYHFPAHSASKLARREAIGYNGRKPARGAPF
ncbi:hypothetical protein, partial [uncultured Anaerotruncus sp.]|uniref:hypothetical protein n=1 Tax=uncultured Anaerotruncus sp. TaxID=905011 RepID=UPI00321FBD87